MAGSRCGSRLEQTWAEVAMNLEFTIAAAQSCLTS